MGIFSWATNFLRFAPAWGFAALGLDALIGIGFCLSVLKPGNARKAKVSPQYPVSTWCADHGHGYAIHNTGWRCGVCGNYVAGRDGELYGPPEQGRIDRRREDRHAA